MRCFTNAGPGDEFARAALEREVEAGLRPKAHLIEEYSIGSPEPDTISVSFNTKGGRQVLIRAPLGNVTQTLAEQVGDMPITLPEAVVAAKEFFEDLVRHGLVAKNVYDIVLEEIAGTPAKNWLITLGYRTTVGIPGLGTGLIGTTRAPRSEVFKVFTVNGKTGEVEAMSIRESR
jgi:hypothetical protein